MNQIDKIDGSRGWSFFFAVVKQDVDLFLLLFEDLVLFFEDTVLDYESTLDLSDYDHLS